MHIARHTSQELVVAAGTRWVSAICAAAAFFTLVSYPQVPLMFHNDGPDSRGNAHFTNVGTSLGFTHPYVACGAAYADINNDGALDFLVSTNGGPAYLFQNAGITNNGLRIKTVGRRSNRSGIGAVVRVQPPSGIMSKVVHSGSSYCSQSELTLTFGMGAQMVAEQVEIQWPSGERDVLKNLSEFNLHGRGRRRS